MKIKSYPRKTLFYSLVLSINIYLLNISLLLGQTLQYAHPRPTGDWISSVAIVPGTERFIAIAENTNNIFQSNDLGGTITVRNDVPIDYSSDYFAGGYGDIEFVNETTGFLISGEIIYRTTDAGNTFVEVSNGSVFRHNKIVMNGNFGAAWTARRILYTSDGGSTWSTQDVPTSEFIGDIAVLSDGKVIIVGSDGFYQESIDGARTWTDIITPVSSDRFIVNVNFVNDNDGFISTDFADVYYTNNGGATWKESISEPNTPFDFVDIDLDGIVRGVERGTLFQSNDAGASWTELFDFDRFIRDDYGDYIRMDITSLDFQGDLGVATGEHGLMLVSRDAGVSWTLLTELLTEKDIDDLHQFGDQVMAVGDGFVLTSSDGGDNWQVASRPADEALNYVDRMANGSWIIGGDGDVYLSNDFGATWTVINLGSNFEIFQGLIGEDDKIFLVGEKGQIAQSTDNGLTWLIDTLPLSNENHDLTSIDFVTDSIGVVGGENDAVFKTVDGGMTWSDISLPTNSTWDIVLLKLLSPDELLVYRNQDFYRSSDGGFSYERFSREDAQAIAILDDGMGINTELGDIRLTSDYGETWRVWTDLADNSFTKATVNEEGNVLFSGEGGVIVKIENIFMTSSLDEEVTSSPELDFKVVPNPTRGQFNVVFEKPITSPYTVKICNVSGQLVYIQESFGFGLQSIDVDIEGHLPAGSYFISLEAKGSILVSKRFILIK